jgi:hypothetical protein
MLKRVIVVSLVLAVFMAGAIWWAPAAEAVGTTIKVTSTDPDTGGPDCKLRDAITAANTADISGGCDGRGGGPVTIELGANQFYTLKEIDNKGTSGNNGLPQVSGNITINAHGSTIQRDPILSDTTSFRFFQVEESAVLRLNEVTLRNGHATQGAAIYNGGNVTVRNSAISGNRGGCGGGILNDDNSTLKIANSTFSYNEAFE